MKDLIINAKKGDKKSLEEIIENFKPLINNTAISFYIYGYDSDDIKQIATIAIIKAIDKFNVELINSFPAYVKKCVRNSLYKEIEKATKVYFKNKESKEIATLIDHKEIIDEGINIQDDYLKKEGKVRLEKAIRLLSEKDRSILKYLYVENKTLKKYAEENSLEYHKARYMKDKAIRKLKELYLTINK
ncbi:sigma-70 family RNA polymerase sigma factor [uncultured Clostridium sp.]|uniref:sigma-70 family RNA polymerase sigma factor n=1 Tax=uncultured Clostridium sp. TaxID=59620 RepID=UPI00258B112A|nr:sigma-70 family RNA polymerase sigma factor [uncultured Clostridium sp.]